MIWVTNQGTLIWGFHKLMRELLGGSRQMLYLDCLINTYVTYLVYLEDVVMTF